MKPQRNFENRVGISLIKRNMQPITAGARVIANPFVEIEMGAAM